MPSTKAKPHLLTDVRHWLERAEEARITAETFNDLGAKRTMLDIAKSYDFLAESAAHRLANNKPNNVQGCQKASRGGAAWSWCWSSADVEP